jgi:hypothetical protein
MIGVNYSKIEDIDKEINIIVSTEDPTLFSFVFTEGEYKGIAFTYSNIKVNDDNLMEFEYTILDNRDNIEVDKDQFENRIVKYFQDFLQYIAENGEK